MWELGKKAGVHWNTVSAIELGKSGGRPQTLKAVQRALERGGVEFTNSKQPGVRLRNVDFRSLLAKTDLPAVHRPPH